MKDIQLKLIFMNHRYLTCDILWTLEAVSNILKNCIEHVDQDGIIQ